MTKILLGVVIILVLEAAAAVVLTYTGLYDVRMSNHDNAVANWFFDTGMTRSVRRHARNIQVPPNLAEPALAQEGLEHYQAMCAACHGAPGEKRGDIAAGLWPKPPDLSKTVPEWSESELFWITKNGIKFSAMPAWGPSHDDREIWAIVAFLEKLPHLSAADYEKARPRAGLPADAPRSSSPGQPSPVASSPSR